MLDSNFLGGRVRMVPRAKRVGVVLLAATGTGTGTGSGTGTGRGTGTSISASTGTGAGTGPVPVPVPVHGAVPTVCVWTLVVGCRCSVCYC